MLPGWLVLLVLETVINVQASSIMRMRITPSVDAAENNALHSNPTNGDDIEGSTGDLEEGREPSLAELLVNANLSSVTLQARKKSECTVLAAATAAYTYSFSTDELAEGAKQYLKERTPFALVKEFKKKTFGDRDYAGLWSSSTECIMNFKGSNSANDFINDIDDDRVSGWGLRNIHQGIKRELKGLLEEMDFELIRNSCKGKTLSVTGHSFGGGMAQLFAFLLNKKEDPLKAGIKVDYIFSFGAMPVANKTLTNDAAPNGEFKGLQFYNSKVNPSGDRDFVDVSKMKFIGSHELEPVECNKAVLTGRDDDKHRVFKYSEYIRNLRSQKKWVKFHSIKNYITNLGCADFKSFYGPHKTVWGHIKGFLR